MEGNLRITITTKSKEIIVEEGYNAVLGVLILNKRANRAEKNMYHRYSFTAAP